jgi:hypothetical protein
VRIFSSKISKSENFIEVQGCKECTRGLKYLKEQSSEEIASTRVQQEGLRKFLSQKILKCQRSTQEGARDSIYLMQSSSGRIAVKIFKEEKIFLFKS